MRHAADVHLQDLACAAEELVQVEDPLGDFGRRRRPSRRLEVGGAAGLGRSGSADLGHALLEHPRLVFEVGLLGLMVVRDEAVDGDSDVGCVGGVSHLRPRGAIGMAVLGPMLGRAAEDAEEYRQAEFDRRITDSGLPPVPSQS